MSCVSCKWDANNMDVLLYMTQNYPYIQKNKVYIFFCLDIEYAVLFFSEKTRLVLQWYRKITGVF